MVDYKSLLVKYMRLVSQQKKATEGLVPVSYDLAVANPPGWIDAAEWAELQRLAQE